MEILRGVRTWRTWSADELQVLVDAISSAVPDLELDWDVDAGEEWVRVIDSDDVECLIRAPTSVSRSHRFAFLRASGAAAGTLRPLLGGHSVETIELADLDEPMFSARLDDLEAFIGSTLPPRQAFDRKRFSANDLWFVST